MSKIGKIVILSGMSLCMGGVAPVWSISAEPESEPVAGEVIKEEKVKPFVQVEPFNITEVLQTPPADAEPNIYFNADELISNDKEKTIEALGDVVVKREGMTLYADKLVYRQTPDTITAIGNVRLEEENGNVIFAGPFRGYGNLIIIEHGKGYLSLLAGLDSIDCELGQMLLAGEPVGLMPDTNDSKLYIEIRKDNHPINPLTWIKN